MPDIEVRTSAASYMLRIAPGLIHRAGDVIHAIVPSDRAMLIVDEALRDLYVDPVVAALADAGCEALVESVEAVEVHKSLLSATRLYGAALRGRLERGHPIIALGGGVVGDLAGFVAATYMRGVPFVQIPTTLLAMVDASIGGKTGVNLPLPATDDADAPALAKNIVGAFWQPRVVLMDPNVLQSLDRRHFNCGLAECIKHAVLADASLFEFIADHMASIHELNEPNLIELIARCAQIKAEVVASDEREAGRRALLNLGHTFAHAIEPIRDQDLQHGEAVAIGLCAAAHVAVATGRLEAEAAERIAALIQAAGLPTKLRRQMPAETLMQAMWHDKKVASGRLRLVLPTSIGSATIVDDVPADRIRDAWLSVGAAP